MSILVGTAGYSYDNWIGHFYPNGTNKQDFLNFYAQQFRLVEVNYTYHRIPAARTLAAMAHKTGPDFQFIIKANSAMAHQRDARAEDFVGFADALEPLQQADKLGCVLAQFPYSFRANSQNVDYLRRFRELVPALPVVIEFRNAKWITKKTFEFLRGLDFGFCCVDQPRFDSLVPPVANSSSAAV